MLRQGIFNKDGEVVFPTGGQVFVNVDENGDPVPGGGGGSGGGGGHGGEVTVTNFPETQPVSGAVSVSNFPATQPVSGTFWPTTQPVSGAVSVSNFPGTQPVSGTVTVSNQPSTMAVTGTFWQATQPVSGPITNAQFSAIAGTAAIAAWDGTSNGTLVAILKALHAQNEEIKLLLEDIKTNTTPEP